MAFLEIDDGNALHYDLHAPTTQAVTFVFCNPMGGGTAFWRENIAPVLHDRGFGTLAFDYRGQGQSRYDDKATLEPDEIIADVGRIMAEVAPDNSVLVGISIGGQYAAQAIQAGAGAIGLVMSNSLRKAGPHTEWIIELENRLIELGGLQLAEQALSPIISSDDYLAILQKAQPENKEYRPFPPDNPRLRIGRGLAKYRWDLDYESIRVPVLALAGSHDRLFRVGEHVDELAARFPDATVKYFPHGGHVLHREIPAEFADTLAAFAEQLRPGATGTSQKDTQKGLEHG